MDPEKLSMDPKKSNSAMLREIKIQRCLAISVSHRWHLFYVRAHMHVQGIKAIKFMINTPDGG